MKHIGKVLKDHIEKRGMMKRDIALKVGISYNYLSTIFRKHSIDAELLEKLCLAVGLSPCDIFEVPETVTKNYSDISASTSIGNASVAIGNIDNTLKDKEKIIAEKERLIAEKERTIQLLMATIKNNNRTENGPKEL